MQTREAADYTEVACHLFELIKNSNHNEIMKLIEKSLNDYEHYYSAFTTNLLRITGYRTHSEKITGFINQHPEESESIEIIKAIFQVGGWKEGSFNIFLMRNLLSHFMEEKNYHTIIDIDGLEFIRNMIYFLSRNETKLHALNMKLNQLNNEITNHENEVKSLEEKLSCVNQTLIDKTDIKHRVTKELSEKRITLAGLNVEFEEKSKKLQRMINEIYVVDPDINLSDLPDKTLTEVKEVGKVAMMMSLHAKKINIELNNDLENIRNRVDERQEQKKKFDTAFEIFNQNQSSARHEELTMMNAPHKNEEKTIELKEKRKNLELFFSQGQSNFSKNREAEKESAKNKELEEAAKARKETAGTNEYSVNLATLRAKLSAMYVQTMTQDKGKGKNTIKQEASKPSSCTHEEEGSNRKKIQFG